MNTIKPLHTLTRQEVRELAQAAVERGEALQAANVFDPGTSNHFHFIEHFNEFTAELLGIPF